MDSCTALHHVVRLGLRPLVFSMDNSFNDPKAEENILKLVETLKVPFFRYVLDLSKFKELQAAYLKAGVINIEATYDHVLMASTYEMAEQYNIKWIISGGNVSSESIMPMSWSFKSGDLRNLKAIYKWATGRKLTGLPVCGLFKWNYYKWLKGIKILYLLDYLDYKRIESEKMLEEKYGFQSTGEKHEENIFTRWYQSFYLFEKFSIDKRKAHYSSLINSGQLERTTALQLLEKSPVYPCLGIEKRIMSYTKHSHKDFSTNEWLFNLISDIVRSIRRIKRYVKRISKRE